MNRRRLLTLYNKEIKKAKRQNFGFSFFSRSSKGSKREKHSLCTQRSHNQLSVGIYPLTLETDKGNVYTKNKEERWTRAAENTVGSSTTKVGSTRVNQAGVYSPLLVVHLLCSRLQVINKHWFTLHRVRIIVSAKGKYEYTLCELIEVGFTERQCTATGLTIPLLLLLFYIIYSGVPFTKSRKLMNLKKTQISGEVMELKQKCQFLGITQTSLEQEHSENCQ